DPQHAVPGLRLEPPPDGADPGDQLAQAERLDDVIVRAELQTDDAVRLLRARGDDDDRDAQALAQRTADHEAIDIRQPKIEQHDIQLRHLEHLRTHHGAHNVKALAAQALRKRNDDRVLVLDNQNLHQPIVTATRQPDIGTFPNPYHILS